MIDIRNIQGNVIYSTEINQGAKRKFQLMKEDYITLPFSLKEPKTFDLGSYADIDAGLFEVVDVQKPTLNTSTGGYDYQLRLDAYYWKWKNKIFKYTPQKGGQEASWSLTATLDVHLGIFIDNLNALGYKYRGVSFEFSIDSTVENSAKVLTYENINMIDALSMLAEEWECEWWITDNIIHFGRCEYGTPVDFEIGVNVAEMSRTESSSKYATRLYIFGSTRNLPPNYRAVDESVVVNGVVQRRLMLPKGIKYIDAYENMSQEEAIEEVVILEDIYPKTDGNISSVETYTPPAVENEDGTTTEETFYRFKDNGIRFSKDFILEGSELRALFTSGSLNGMEFGLVFNPNGKDESTEEAQLFEIVANEDYGRKLPDAVLHPKVGDKYILIGWDSTKIADLGLVSKAEEQLYQEGLKLSAKRKIDPNTYGCKMFSDYMYGLNPDGEQDEAYSKHFEVGDKVNLINAAYLDNGRQSRIIGYEYNLDYPFDNPVYTIGETASYSRFGALESKLDALTYGGQTYTGKGGSGVYVIGTNDVTKATDRNVYSALRTDKTYLSKTKDDRSKGLIASDKGFEAGEFTSGATGVGVYQNADGQWVIETDNLSVRRKFSANEVEIQTTNHIGGQTLLTAARMVIESVDEMSDRFRCIYRKRDGEGNVISQQWKVGDQAFCNTFNLEKQADGAIGNHYYWREVVEVSADNWNEDYYYVDLSISKCDSKSSIPKVGDKVVQLGYSKEDDADRQNAIIIAGAGTGSPYIQLFVGINSFVLPEPEQLKPGDNRLSGRLTIKEGSTGWRNLEGLPDSIQEALTMSEEAKKFVESQEYGKNNLLRNSGFTGDYVTASLQEGDVLTGGSDMFSPSLVHWISDGATPMESDVSESGKEVMLISGGSLRQEIVNKVMVGESYVFSFRGRGIGSVTFSFGGYTKNIAFNSEDWELYVEKFVATADSQRFAIEAYEDCFLCELQLERGTLRSAWGISPLDNRSELAKYESLRYMSDAIEKGSTDVLGGLILTNMMLMRNLENKVTSGSSGVYSDDNSVAYFAGGDMEAAVRTAMAYMDDPTYQPTQEELNNMAKYVVTHGGRAILNDVILRGYIYALGGKFKGEIEATSGIFKNVTSPNGRFSIDENGFVRVSGGRIGGFSVNGNRLSNQDEKGNYLTDAVVSSRNFNSVNETDRMAEIGADVLSGVNGVSCVGRFENNDQNRQAGTNYGIMVGAYNAKNNAAISMEGGYIQGFALKTTILNSYATSYSINKKDANILCWNNNNLTIYLPSMSSFDDGHFIRIKRLGSSITLRTMDCETIKSDGSIRTSKPVFISGDTSVSVIDTNGLSLGGQLGAVLELVWVRDIEHNVNGTTYYGAWVVINKL